MRDQAAGAVLLVIAGSAVWTAAFRVAARLTPDGLERAVAAAPLAVATVVVQALALGVFGLGGTPLVLVAAAIATWAAVRTFVPAPAPGALAQLAAWARSLSGPGLVAACALGGLWAGALVWALRFPYLGLDGGTYHLAAAVLWAQEGNPGAHDALYAGVPVGSYPLTAEVALAWGIGIADSFAPVAVWTTGIVALLVGAAWLGLRRLAVPAAIAALAIVSLLLVPLVLRGAVQADTDVPALALLAAAGALSACARERPVLLAPALVAAGLAIGIKTTTAPLALLVIVLGAWPVRDRLRALWRPLAAAALLATAAGGVWYLRNLLLHGSPLWPFRAAPWGDDVPPLLSQLDQSLLSRPRATLEGQLDVYRSVLAGGVVLLAAGLASPLWARRRRVQAAAALVTLGALLAWASAPFTGAGAAPFLQINTLRYLIPALAAAVAAVALSGRGGRAPALVAATGLGAAAIWSAVKYADNPYLPGEPTLVAASLLAAAALAVAARVRVPPVAAAGALAVCLAALLAFSGDRYSERRAGAGDFDAGIVSWFGGEQAWRDGDEPIAQSPTPIAVLAGDDLRHPLELVRPEESCARVRARLREGWVVVRSTDPNVFGSLAAERCLRDVRPRFVDGIHRVYGGP